MNLDLKGSIQREERAIRKKQIMGNNVIHHKLYMINCIVFLNRRDKSFDDAVIVDAEKETSALLLIEKRTNGFDVNFFRGRRERNFEFNVGAF